MTPLFCIYSLPARAGRWGCDVRALVANARPPGGRPVGERAARGLHDTRDVHQRHIPRACVCRCRDALGARAVNDGGGTRQHSNRLAPAPAAHRSSTISQLHSHVFRFAYHLLPFPADARTKHLEATSQAISVLLGYVFAHSHTLAYEMRKRPLSAAMFADEESLNTLVPAFYRCVVAVCRCGLSHHGLTWPAQAFT